MENFTLKVQDLYLKYFGGYLGVDMVSFETNDSIAILGKSLSGKTSLLRCIAGLEKYEGSVNTSAQEIVFSFDLNSLNKSTNVKDNIAYPLVLRKEQNIDDKVLNIAKVFKIDSILNEDIAKLSLSQKRLVILSRAFVRDADLYLLDDPLKDVEDRSEYFKILLDIMKGKNVLYATTEKDEALAFNKMLCMSYKRAIGYGKQNELLAFPKSVDILKLFKDYEYENIILNKDGDKHYIEYENKKYNVCAPISEIYLNKEVLVPIEDKKPILDYYFDASTEYLISRT